MTDMKSPWILTGQEGKKIGKQTNIPNKEFIPILDDPELKIEEENAQSLMLQEHSFHQEEMIYSSDI